MRDSSSPGARRGSVALAVGGFALLIHLPWEFWQAPLFTGMRDAAHWQATLFCTRATLGDAGIALVAYSAIAGITGHWSWLLEMKWARVLGFVAFGLIITVGFELMSVYVLDRWHYGPSMPVIGGVGLTPLLQWTLLPPLGLWLARRHLMGARDGRPCRSEG